ncbi:MAG: D-2-hydroxyacid dehydrogenase [Microbacterium sp.]
MVGRHVLLSERMAPAIAGLERDYPSLTFGTVPMEGPFLPEYLDADVLWMSALSDEIFDRILAENERLSWIQLTAAGFDWILRDALERRMDGGMLVSRSGNSFNVPIAEYVLAAILSACRRFPALVAGQQRREWLRLEAAEIGGSTVTVLGTGSIGQEIAWRCRALGARVIGISRSGAPAEGFDVVGGPQMLHDVLPDTDSLVIAAPLTPETEGMIGATELALLPVSAQLVNIGRGAIVDTAAMVAALRAGELAAAAVDVFDEEPLPESSELWDVPNLFVTPHTSFRGEGNPARLEADFRLNLDRYLSGEPLIGTMKSRELGY